MNASSRLLIDGTRRIERSLNLYVLYFMTSFPSAIGRYELSTVGLRMYIRLEISMIPRVFPAEQDGTVFLPAVEQLHRHCQYHSIRQR